MRIKSLFNITIAIVAVVSLSNLGEAMKPERNSSSVSVSKNTNSNNTNSNNADQWEITPEREAAALKFAELHHPELVQLLEALREIDQKQFRKAIEEIFRVSEKLARSKSRNPERYDLELKAWKLTSRLNLLVASLPMASDYDAAMQNIKKAYTRKLEIQIKLLEMEEVAARKRLERIQESIASSQSDQEENINKQLQRIRKMYPPDKTEKQAKQ
ncbi:hypothetical protein [Rubinisphaera italica]|uniref:Uncharacterized protein n=1 Tax=Rubinisphaera italica TaxID=2527969 RepID=A0A5C5XBM9_9PLAN|nr:hypothetical protein [Rubinisphaera italica]TWT60420.1 hypothetical protein Pan54_11340 [Rubinisphaera italica]